ncbi:DUF305 domain-containing protein [Nocardia sp. NPDC004068]|uniref:DUF305 domain-containing protein n=1 Tax=Nocardia sp. NPDC004068 TaxID=3364303 RepID=UPI00368E2623
MRPIGKHWLLLVPALGLAALLLVMGAALGPLWWPRTADTANTVRLTDAEIDFAQDMSVHHEQAIFLTQNLDKGADPAIVTLAQQVSANQIQEIGTMRGWLMLIEAPLRPGPEAAPQHAGMAMPQHPPAAMPGMATWDEINALGRAKGRDAEIHFLQLMIRHHRGGIDMAQAAIPRLNSAAVARVARGMIQDQTQEIGYMSLLLRQRGESPLPYP